MVQRGEGVAREGGRKRLTAQDWADVALSAMGEGGLAAVAVEPLAARLGTTKGSFYWHFANRESLIEAALDRWEHKSTEAIIAALESEPDPETRLRRLFSEASELAAHDPLEVSLPASAGHPRVAAVLRRVTERRVGYLAQLFVELGFPPDAAGRRALLAYTGYLGHTQLTHAVPETLPAGEDGRRYLDSVIDTLMAAAPEL
ncbi:AcrR family transcriptional regulator [Streptomyces griseochromogenes]|uniref:AcrR family transcriptional regulator n=2 Tax=Streptomyces griseochromogenes TaxID=68214 RepID=A0A1B1BDN9_9ACTN|nr:TetR/AcrR family transcriptional regulator [Streptomyces griseochromogenes]ANP56852.1 TetR family transcriptional regulator [Streptomyces griseochromogenes]MBP2047688.1 AcrR family transcriptional regulator [Streptomyces griseochromogenes]